MHRRRPSFLPEETYCKSFFSTGFRFTYPIGARFPPSSTGMESKVGCTYTHTQAIHWKETTPQVQWNNWLFSQ